MTTAHKPIWIVTGPRGVGKTRFCLNLVRVANQRGLSTNGLICPPAYEGETKTAIHLLDLHTNQQRILARVRDHNTAVISTDHWVFDQEVLEWGNQILTQIEPCDLLIIDELGPLEFKRGLGWQSAFVVLEQQNYDSAVVVIRPELIINALTCWKGSKILEVPPILDAEKELELHQLILAF